METNQEQRNNEIIAGRNAVLEALKAGRTIDTLLLAKGEHSGSVNSIIATCKQRKIVIKQVDTKKLDFLCGRENHQGVAAYAAVKAYADIEDIFKAAEEKQQPPFIIICDELEDPHNLGAVIRTADASGAHGVIIPERRSVSLSYAVGKTSAGAVEYVPVARVGNLAATIEKLKERGVWVYGADMDGQDCFQTDFSGPIALVVGSEGHGLGRLVKEKCDVIVSLPMKGKINSLNASVAAGIIMYEISRQRL